MRAILRVRKTRNVIEDETKDDESDWEWKSQRRKKLRVKKKATKRRCSSRKNAASDEGVFLAETVKPQKSDSKKKIKRDNYLKKYKLMKEKRSYACDLCKKTFITASHLKEHILSHCQCFPCKECGKVFNHLRSLQRHVAAGHEFNPEHEPDGTEAESKNESEFTA